MFIPISELVSNNSNHRDCDVAQLESKEAFNKDLDLS